MGIKALSWAFDTPLETGPKFVLIALAEHAGDHSGEDWTCYPSVERLMAMTGMSRSTVERHLKTLEGDGKTGWIRRRRRVRPDGRLGIYDYTLRREKLAETLAAMAAKAGKPHVKLTHGPDVNLTEAMRQSDENPHVNLTHEEPSLEPSLEPQGAREPGDDGFEDAWAILADVVRRRSSPPASRSAWAKTCDLVEASRLMAAAIRWTAECPDLKRGVATSFERWLNNERWRYWLSGEGPSETQPSSRRTGFGGPAEFRAAIVLRCGEGFALSYLDPAAWDGERNAVFPATGFAATTLQREALRVFREHRVNLGEPISAARRAAGGKQ